MTRRTVLQAPATFALPAAIDEALAFLEPAAAAARSNPPVGGPGWAAWPDHDLRAHVEAPAVGSGRRTLRVSGDADSKERAAERLRASGLNVTRPSHRTRADDLSAGWTVELDRTNGRIGERSRVASAATIRALLDQIVEALRSARAAPVAEEGHPADALVDGLLPALVSRLGGFSQEIWSASFIPASHGMIISCETLSNPILATRKTIPLWNEVLPGELLLNDTLVLSVDGVSRRIDLRGWFRKQEIDPSAFSPIDLAKSIRDPSISTAVEAVLGYEGGR